MLKMEDWTFYMLTGKMLLWLAFIISLVRTICLSPRYYSIYTDRLSESIGIPTFRIDISPYSSKMF